MWSRSSGTTNHSEPLGLGRQGAVKRTRWSSCNAARRNLPEWLINQKLVCCYYYNYYSAIFGSNRSSSCCKNDEGKKMASNQYGQQYIYVLYRTTNPPIQWQRPLPRLSATPSLLDLRFRFPAENNTIISLAARIVHYTPTRKRDFWERTIYCLTYTRLASL